MVSEVKESIESKAYCYNLKDGSTIKVTVSFSYSEHQKKYEVCGSESSFLTMGTLDALTTKVIKTAMKKYISDNNIKTSGEIKHSIFGTYAIEVA